MATPLTLFWTIWRKRNNLLLKESNWVKENWRFIVGNSIRIRFWLDLWCGTAPLRHSFPIIFDLAVNKFETVADVWDQTVGNDNWKLNLYTDFYV